MRGRIIYLSSSFPGAWNDSLASRDSSDEWLSKLAGEWGLADSGFKSLLEAGHTVFTPPTKHNTLYNLHSSYRILVEQRIGVIKQWWACKDPISVSQLRKKRNSKFGTPPQSVDCCFCTRQ
jgi:hypothetical protein